MDTKDIAARAATVLAHAEATHTSAEMEPEDRLLFWRLLHDVTTDYVLILAEEVKLRRLQEQVVNHGRIRITGGGAENYGEVYCGACARWLRKDGAMMPEEMDDFLDQHSADGHVSVG